MIYRDFDIRANLCNKVGHKRYQFTVDGEVVYETDDASMYDALSGNEEDWDMEEYQNANGACEFILHKMEEEEYIIYLLHDLDDEFKGRHYYSDTYYPITDARAYSSEERDAKRFYNSKHAEKEAKKFNKILADYEINAKAIVYNLLEDYENIL